MNPTVREYLETRERETLSALACLSEASRGRKKSETESSLRTCFMRDRDRIVHSTSFRRLKHKTQVFLLSSNDLIRTRLTHTLEVSQISRTIARALNLNEDLTEAIALAHDLGHPPFGHTGETVLNKLFSKGFRHNLQSLRVVDFLEKHGTGLNLSFEVRDGILKHSKWGQELFAEKSLYTPFTLEAQIVKICDRVAYINHDLDDALRSELIKKEQIPAPVRDTLGDSHSQRINTIVSDIIEQSGKAQKIAMGENIRLLVEEARSFLIKNVYQHPHIRKESVKAAKLISDLYRFYTSHPKLLWQKVKDIKYPKGTSKERMTVDYISMMTDNFALKEYKRCLLPRHWFTLDISQR